MSIGYPMKCHIHDIYMCSCYSFMKLGWGFYKVARKGHYKVYQHTTNGTLQNPLEGRSNRYCPVGASAVDAICRCLIR